MDMVKNILIIDDDPAFRESVGTLLESKGVHVFKAVSGEEGFACAKKEKPEMILLDLMMATDHEGFDVSKRIKENPDTKEIPVILITGVSKDKGVNRSYGPNDFYLPVKTVLRKPVKPDLLLSTIEKYSKN